MYRLKVVLTFFKIAFKLRLGQINIAKFAVVKSDMENLAQEWLHVEQLLMERFGKKPDMEGILFLVGINELGASPANTYSKEQKQDLMHIGVCALLSTYGYYEFVLRDEDGWPHYRALKPVPEGTLLEQEYMLKKSIIEYFR